MVPMRGIQVVQAFHEPYEFRIRAPIESGGGPPHSKTLPRWRQSRALPPGFGVRRPCGALDCPDRFMVPMHAKKRKGALHEPWLVWSSGFRRLGGLGPAEVGTPSCQFEPFRGAMHPIIRLMRGLNQGEFKNRHKSRSRRGNEAELFFAPKSASSRRRLPSLNTPRAEHCRRTSRLVVGP